MRRFLLLSGWVLLSLVFHRALGQERFEHPASGIPVIFSAEGDIFPYSWYESPINGTGVSLDTSEYKRSRTVITRALDKYPAALLLRDLEKVYVLRDIRFYGLGYGGTNSNRMVYVTNDGADNGYSDAYIERVFHAEFSSVLLRKYKDHFDEAAWLGCNARGFSYGGSGVDALRSGETAMEFTDDYNEMGVLYQYATSDMENDFNSFAKNLFCPMDGFWERVQKFPRLKKKLEIIIDFYRRLNPVFTEKYFRAFEKK